jgi:hypothetical protein
VSALAARPGRPTDVRRSRSRTVPVALSALAVLAVLGGCGDDDAVGTGAGGAPPPGLDGSPAYEGEITEITPFEPVTEDCVEPGDLEPDEPVSSDDPPTCSDPDTDLLGTVLVEEQPGVWEGAKIALQVDATTVLRRTGAGEGDAVSFDELTAGDRVAAWVSDPVADSYPQQGRADALVVQG